MPYVSIKTFPQDGEAKKKAAEKIVALLMDVWGCERDWISVSVEDVAPDKWEEQVVKGEIEPNGDKMLIRDGKKLYR